MESRPTDADTVRAFHDVEIAVDAILYVTVVHPHVLCANQADIIAVVGINIVGSWAAQGQVADNDIPTAIQQEDTGILIAVEVTDGGS